MKKQKKQKNKQIKKSKKQNKNGNFRTESAIITANMLKKKTRIPAQL
jgi:hypothetical protein